MIINIQRKRYVIIKDKKQIFCGVARSYNFKDMDDIKDTAIKTYLSEAKARASFLSSWWDGQKLIDDGRIEFVEIVESISSEVTE